MHLTADTFAEITRLLRSEAPHGGIRERRKHPRVGVNAKAVILMPAKLGAKAIPVSVRDLSAEGVGLLVAEPVITVGDEFVLVFVQGRQLPRQKMLFRAVRVARPSSALYLIGASLIQEVKGDLLADVRPPAEEAKPPPARPPLPPRASSVLYLPPEAAPGGADLDAVRAVEDRLARLAA